MFLTSMLLSLHPLPLSLKSIKIYPWVRETNFNTRPSYVITLGLWVCKATMKASPELVRFSLWPLFHP